MKKCTIAIKLIPPEIMEECRNEAKDLFKSAKPQNRIAAFLIILIWLIITSAIILKIFL